MIDLTELFSVSGSRPMGSHLHCIDIKNLMIHTVLGSGRWDRPTWCSVKEWSNVKHTLFIMVGYVSGEDYIVYKECFRNIDKHFTQVFSFLLVYFPTCCISHELKDLTSHQLFKQWL